MDIILAASEKEEGILIEMQPLYVDYEEMKIKCFELFSGSTQVKHINQHVWKLTTHQKRKKDYLKTGGGQRDLREYFM